MQRIIRRESDPWSLTPLNGSYSDKLKRYYVAKETDEGLQYHPTIIYRRGTGRSARWAVDLDLHVHLSDEDRDVWVQRRYWRDSLGDALATIEAFDRRYAETVIEMTYREAFPNGKDGGLFEMIYAHDSLDFQWERVTEARVDLDAVLDDHERGLHRRAPDDLCPACLIQEAAYNVYGEDD